MRIADMNWMQVEEYSQRDDRCVLPLGTTEQHAQLSLSVDASSPSGWRSKPPSRSACRCFR